MCFNFSPLSPILASIIVNIEEDKIPLKHLSDTDMRMFLQSVYVCCINGR